LICRYRLRAIAGPGRIQPVGRSTSPRLAKRFHTHRPRSFLPASGLKCWKVNRSTPLPSILGLTADCPSVPLAINPLSSSADKYQQADSDENSSTECGMTGLKTGRSWEARGPTYPAILRPPPPFFSPLCPPSFRGREAVFVCSLDRRVVLWTYPRGSREEGGGATASAGEAKAWIPLERCRSSRCSFSQLHAHVAINAVRYNIEELTDRHRRRVGCSSLKSPLLDRQGVVGAETTLGVKGHVLLHHLLSSPPF